jgi:hypothetical protein
MVALIMEVLATLHENAPSLGSQIRGKVLAKTIRIRTKDRLTRSGKKGVKICGMKIVKKLSTPSDTSNYSPNFSST